MDIDHRSATLRGLARSALGGATQRFSAAVGATAVRRGAPLVLGSALDEPWHFVSHLAGEAERAGRADLRPTWVRWQAPPVAAAHLRCTVDDLGDLAPHAGLLVVSAVPDEHLLERVADARRRGATVLSLQGGDGELAALAHEHLEAPAASFDAVQHLVTELAPLGADRRARVLDELARPRWRPRRRGAPDGPPPLVAPRR